ncbi:MAG: PKD domain-containing protein [Dehalococcoidia bacterium]|nr:PKD domain-containing protein [Dehalococcoidia bacterium]
MARLRTSPGDITGIVFALALSSLFVIAPPATAETPPAVPVISMVMASRTTVFTAQSTELFCVAHHDDGAPLTYTWSSTTGKLVPSGDSAIWFAPEDAGTYSIGVEVHDEAGAIAYDSLEVMAVENLAPAVSAVTADPDALLPGESATIACEAQDLEGHSITYDWISSTGTLSGSGPVVTWTAPALPGSHHVVVRVRDEMGAVRTRNVAVSVRCPNPPSIQEVLVWPTLPDYTKEDMRGGYRLLRGSLTSCELECIATTPYGDIAYEWSCTDGSIEGRGPIVLFIPPNDTAEVHVSVRATDVCGNSDEQELVFWVYQREEYSNEILSNPGGCLRCLENH